MRINSSMTRILQSSPLQGDQLPVEQQDLLSRGWIIGPAGSLLLAGMYGDGWRSDWSPDEVSQMEYEINDIYVDPEGIPHDRRLFLVTMASRGMTFAKSAMRLL